MYWGRNTPLHLLGNTPKDFLNKCKEHKYKQVEGIMTVDNRNLVPPEDDLYGNQSDDVVNLYPDSEGVVTRPPSFEDFYDDSEPDDFDPLSNPIHALRLEFGDLDKYDYILSDQSYQYYLDKYPESPNIASKNVGMAILARFAREGYRQRVGQEEAYQGERYKNYLDWLKQKISNPALSGRVPAVYVGGVLRDTVEFYETNPKFMSSTFYRGQQEGVPKYLEEQNIGLGFNHSKHKNNPIK